mgnify:CR=1 FL=1
MHIKGLLIPGSITITSEWDLGSLSGDMVALKDQGIRIEEKAYAIEPL